MKSSLKALLVAGFFTISNFSAAGTLQIGPVYLDTVSLIGSPAFGHPAGNMEIKITNGTGNPTGISCDSNYVATKNSVPNFSAMLSILLAAQIAQKPVILGLTDDPALMAFGGRCSLVYVAIVK